MSGPQIDGAEREKLNKETRDRLAARERLFEDSIALMECDDLFAERVKSRLENLEFASGIAHHNGSGAAGETKPIDAGIVQSYLWDNYDVSVRKENITVDFDRRFCTVRLNGRYTVEIPLIEGTNNPTDYRPAKPDGGAINVLCYGDSNTFGYNPENGTRYPMDVRWPSRMQKLLGERFHVIEEGCGGRTTVFDDPENGWKNGLSYLRPCLSSHRPLDIMILMLGTNDLKETFHASPQDIAAGAGTLVQVIQEFTAVKQGFAPKILLVSPPHAGEKIAQSPFYGAFTESAIVRSKEFAGLYRQTAEKYGCAFFDAARYVEPSETDSLHLTPEGHRILANELAEQVRALARRERAAKGRPAGKAGE